MRNEHKKITFEDKFARKFYCPHARLNYVRFAKRANSKNFRQYSKSLCKIDRIEGLTNEGKHVIMKYNTKEEWK